MDECMCIGESAADTLRTTEEAFLCDAARHKLPAYAAEVHSNADEISWVVLQPDAASAMPRFTICRIDPCIMLMIEHGPAQRRFVSVGDVEEAMRCACEIVVEEALQIPGAHRAPDLIQ